MDYTLQPDGWLETEHGRIARFRTDGDSNIDPATVASFGHEWRRFQNFSDEEIARIGDDPRTPAQGPTTNVGRVVMPPTATTNSPEDAKESVRSRTSQPTVSSCSHWAVLAKKLATQRNRKSR